VQDDDPLWKGDGGRPFPGSVPETAPKITAFKRELARIPDDLVSVLKESGSARRRRNLSDGTPRKTQGQRCLIACPYFKKSGGK
jgi:hypothetical protein